MAKAYPIKHVVTLMLENGSFDHFFGFLPGAGELTGREFNPLDPAGPDMQRVHVSQRATAGPTFEFPHDLPSVNLQLFGSRDATSDDPAPMNGFVKAAALAGGGAEAGKRAMDAYDPLNVPTFTALAQEFCLCTRWFASVPGPTWPNRFFAHAATSDGVATNDPTHLYEMPTIYDHLAAQGLAGKIYYHDIPQSLVLLRAVERSVFAPFANFAADVRGGRLPAYALIEPRYFDTFLGRANDAHPPHDVRFAEALVADVYATLRASAYWEQTLLIVVFDEHGGMYDHVPPPRSLPGSDGRPRPVPAPGGKVSAAPPFGFDRLGVRVPAILVSPYIAAGRVDATPYEHSSIPATLKKLFGLPDFLTERDAWANTFEGNLTLASPRPALERLPDPDMSTFPPLPPDITRTVPDVLHAGADTAMMMALSFQDSLLGTAALLAHGRLPGLGQPAASSPVLGAADALHAGQTLREHEAAPHVSAVIAGLLRAGRAPSQP